MFNWEVANSYKRLCILLESAFDLNFLAWLVRSNSSGDFGCVLPSLFFLSFLEPRMALNNACQRLFGSNTSNKLRYTHQTRGPQHSVVWTTIIYSGSPPLHIFLINYLITNFQLMTSNMGGERGEPGPPPVMLLQLRLLPS